jgi:hypothetical protein
MAAFISDAVLDAALNLIKNNTENLYITDDTAAPTTFTLASSTYKCGVKATPAFTGPADHTSGRKVTVSAITDGTISATATAKYFALTDDSESLLLCYQELDSTQGVTSGNTFTLTAIIIAIPDPTA